jgi:hypothetical protein
MTRKNTSVDIEMSDLAVLKALKKKIGASISAQVQIAIHEYVDSRRKMGLLDEKKLGLSVLPNSKRATK